MAGDSQSVRVRTAAPFELPQGRPFESPQAGL